ncbi:hypothetical protein HUJ04_004570 [Dendroctonus ponderosae]|uniref:DUF4802 domain-containing protein n=1 Tax=Dendroctonus ponderosae TaxID=77166 RepID=A0AAR5P2D2_DENPD|nr:hypothetical protein HUJ04_004570 [Dendroctonus ponderosae]
MDVRLNVVSTICWEIIDQKTVHLPSEPFRPFKLLLDAMYDFCPAILDRPFNLYWKYSNVGYLEVADYLSMAAFLNLAGSYELFLLIRDCDTRSAHTADLLKMLDLQELKRIKEAQRTKYDLKSEADALEEQIQQCQQLLDSSSAVLTESDAHNDKDIIQFALRSMPMGRCYIADFCSVYSLVDCVRKAMKGRIINCSPHQDIYYLETHAKTEESNLENLFVSPAGREMLKYKPNTKLKQKMNTNLEFRTTIENRSRQSTLSSESNKASTSSVPPLSSSPSTSSTADSDKNDGMDLYEEAAAILGLTCSETDNCRCLECQCHYFDFEEEIDFPTAGNEYGQLLSVDQTSSCSIQ